jgi:hypothetical protein
MTQSNPLNDWINYFGSFYSPMTNTNTNTNTNFNFGCNIEDAPVEKHVVETVGSYGSQLNRVLDALMVILNHQKLVGLSPDEDWKIEALRELAKDADEAAKKFQGQINETRVKKLIIGMSTLQETDSYLYAKLKAQILASFEADARRDISNAGSSSVEADASKI